MTRRAGFRCDTIGVVVELSISVLEVMGLISGPVKSDKVSPPLRRFFGDGSQQSLHASYNTASVKKIVIFFDTLLLLLSCCIASNPGIFNLLLSAYHFWSFSIAAHHLPLMNTF